jgi:hypothetical protein
MPTLIIDDIPASLFARIQDEAKVRKRTPADTVVEVLEAAFRSTKLTFTDAPLPSEPFLTEEICAPFSIPRPAGEIVVPIEIANHLPRPHDHPDGD